MGDMLDNRDFDGGDEPQEEVQEDVTTSEENTEALASESDENIEAEESTEESEDATEEVEETDNVEDTTENNEEDIQSAVKPTRAQRRLRQLLQEKKELQERLAAQQQPEITQSPDGEIEMTPEQLGQYVNNQVQTTLQKEREAQLEREKAAAWDADIAELMEKNPELDPNDKRFNQELSDALVDLIQTTNVDQFGNPIVNKLPSEIYATINSTINAAKSAGKKEASVNLKKTAESTAVQDTTSTEEKTQKYTDEQLVKLQMTDPRKYADLIENNII